MGDLGESVLQTSMRATLPLPNPTKSFWQTSHPNQITNERTTTELPSEADVVVIGSGITAASVVRELLAANEKLKIVVLEARTTCSGATGRNGGHCQPIIHEAKPDIIDFELKNFQYVERLVHDNDIACDWRRLEGCMAVWNPAWFRQSKEELQDHQRQDPSHSKLANMVEDCDDLRKLRLKEAAGAIVQSTAATLSPYKLVIRMWSDMLKANPSLNLQTTTPVTAIDKADDGYTCQTSRGSVASKHVLLAVNGYTSHLLSGFEKLIRPVQGQMSALKPTSSFSGQMLAKSYGLLGSSKKDRSMEDYLHQGPSRSGGHLMFGGGREHAVNYGEYLSDDSFVDPEVEQHLRHLPEQLSFAKVVDCGNDLSSESELEIEASWTGIMGYSSDDFPWVGGVPHREGLWLCGGYTGHGMTNAPGCGQHIARLILAGIDGKDWRSLERQAITNHEIPREYVLTKPRIACQAARHSGGK